MSPEASAVVAASQPNPSRSAACHSSVGSPSGSAAARVNKSRESPGSDRSLLANPSSRRSERRQLARIRQPFGKFRGRPRARQLQQGQRVPVTLGDDALDHPGIGRAGHDRSEQSCRVAVTESVQSQLRQAGKVPAVGVSLAAIRNTIGSASRRRATNSMVWTETRSSHCASSTTHSTG